MILSIHPHFKGDENISLAENRVLTSRHGQIMERASAVVTPQTITEEQFLFCKQHASRIFPDYTNRFGFEGKAGACRLLEKFNLPHPGTVVYESVDHWRETHSHGALPFPFPFVMKADEGGGGWGIFLVKNQKEIEPCLEFYGDKKKNPNRKFIAQEFVDHGGRDLRVVLIGSRAITYWRVQNEPGEFRNNVGRGASIDHHGDPELTQSGLELALELRKRTGINLAAIDILLDKNERSPLIGEINFLFGRKGVGGTKLFREIFSEEAKAWGKKNC